MYSERVVEKSIEKIKARGVPLDYYNRSHCEEMTENLVAAMGPEGKLKRRLSAEEKAFIRNETLMTQCDFKYFSERYGTIELDGAYGGGLGKMVLARSQQLLLEKIAKLQEEQVDAYERGESVDGILICDHKARQVFHTQLARMLMLHRCTRFSNQRCAAISVDEEKVGELYRRDKIIFDNLPWFLKPALNFDVKNDHLQWGTGARVEYFQNNKRSSLGQGKQFDFGHATELSEYENPHSMDIDFFPTLPQSPNTLCILESRANGRGNWWHNFSEKCRKGQKTRWTYCFIPWYSEPKKYRRTPPVDWVPMEVADLHTKMVYETSNDYVGTHYTLTREQLYWWETTRKEYADDGKLNFFLTNYCATPEESFQHANMSAFSTEIIERMRLTALGGVPFEFEKVA